MENWANEPNVSYGKGNNDLMTWIVDRTKKSKEEGFDILPFNLFELREKQENKRPLFSPYDNLYFRLSKIGMLPFNWDNENAQSISKDVIESGRLLIKLFEEINLHDKKIAVHLFPAYDGGIQFEIDGEKVKADIQVTATGTIVVTKYSGKENRVTESQYTRHNFHEIKNQLT
jgi:hypothetical protein